MDSPRERACPSCSAPAQAQQRWCLECGAELPQPRRAALRSVVGIATTLAVLVGAASAGGYTLLQEGKQPPPPPTTVAAAPTPPPATVVPPPATEAPPPYVPSDAPLPATSSTTTTTTTTGGAQTGGASAQHTSSGTGHDHTGGGTGDDEEDEHATGGARRLVLTDIALGAATVVYAPYATDDVDLGDASRAVDGSNRTAWKTPAFADPTASPQLGLYVDLAGRETVRKLVVRTSTPGIDVEVYGARTGPPASIVDAGWDHLATRTDIAAKETIKLPRRPFRYVLVWVVGLPPDAARGALSELSLLSLQPE